MHITQSIVLEMAEISPITSIPFEGRALCDRLATLVRAAGEVVQEATDRDGFWARQPGYHHERLEQVGGLVDLIGNELGRLVRLLDAGDRA